MTTATPRAPKQSSRPEAQADALRDFLKRVGSYTTELIYGVPDGKRLYHYTDLSGLQGMVAHEDLWLTDSRYSNDSEEMRHGYGVARKIIEEQHQLAEAYNNQDEIAVLARISELLGKPPAEAVYIGCFCLEDNLLSQWRGYAANGAGVCVEFNHGMFDSITGPDSPYKGLMRLWKVFYEEATQRSIMSEAIQFGLSRVGSVEERAIAAAEAIFFFVPTFKHHDFHQEDECRLIFTPPPECKVNPRFRVARGMLIPYYSLNDLTDATFRLPIKRVVVGPSPHKELNAGSVRAMLAASGYGHVSVDVSETPFRG